MILATFLLRYEWQDSIFGKDVDDIILGLSLIALQLRAYCHGVMELASWGLSSNEPSSFLTNPRTHRMAWRSLDTGCLGVCPVAPRAHRKAEKIAQMLKMAGAANQRTVNFLRA